jgi:cellulose synthase/poly-beta-1,6-N-acetylglucosamine synthase-like glycosyltransferase
MCPHGPPYNFRVNPPLPSISVIISAYKKIREMDFVLAGYAAQTRPALEIIVSEDAETPEFVDCIARWRARSLPVRLIQQPDDGFQKCLAMNRAAELAQGEILLFTDGDCIPRADFVARHAGLARRGQFLAGGSHINIPQPYHTTHDLIPQIASGELFTHRFLASIWTEPKSALRLTQRASLARLLDKLTPRSAFTGANASVWRDDFFSVRGFDETMGYGGEDLNLGIRLNSAGVRGVRARYSLVCLHLDHGRGYVDAARLAQNKATNRALRSSKATLPGRSSLSSYNPA